MKRRRWISLGIILAGLVTTSFVLKRDSGSDELAALAPYIREDSTRYEFGPTPGPGSPPIPLAFRTVRITGIDENTLVGLLDEGLRGDPKWGPSQVKRYGTWQYIAHQGPDFNAFSEHKTMQAYVWLGKNEKPHVRSQPEFLRSTVILMATRPASKIEVWWNTFLRRMRRTS